MNWKEKNNELMKQGIVLAKEMTKKLNKIVVSGTVNTLSDERFKIATPGSAICVGLTLNGKEVFELYYVEDKIIKNILI